jgi:hypothetical protein
MSARLTLSHGRPRVRAPLAWALAAACLAWASPAAADGRTMVMPLEGELGGVLNQAPAAFAAELAAAAGSDGVPASIAQASISDTAMLVGCDPESPDCLDQVAATLDVDELIFGDVSPGEERGTVVVSVIVYRRGRRPEQRTFVVPARTVEQASSTLGTEFRAYRGGDGAGAPGGPEVSGSRTRFSFAKVQRLPKLLTIGGGALIGVGVVLHFGARSKQREVDEAPTGTVEQLEALEDLERSGQRLSRAGNAMLILGAAAATVGIALAVRQGVVRVDESPAGAVTLAPMPVAGGFGVALTVGAR